MRFRRGSARDISFFAESVFCWSLARWSYMISVLLKYSEILKYSPNNNPILSEITLQKTFWYFTLEDWLNDPWFLIWLKTLQHCISAKCKRSFLRTVFKKTNRVAFKLPWIEFLFAALVKTDACCDLLSKTQKLSLHYDKTVQEVKLPNPEVLICRGSHCSVFSWTESLHLCPHLALGLWLGSLLTKVVLLTQPLTSMAFAIRHVSVAAHWKFPFFFGGRRAVIQKKSNPPTPGEGRGQRKCR